MKYENKGGIGPLFVAVGEEVEKETKQEQKDKREKAGIRKVDEKYWSPLLISSVGVDLIVSLSFFHFKTPLLHP